MIRLSLAALTCTSLIACTDAAPYMQISDADGRDPSTSVVAPGTASFPETVTLLIQGRRTDAGYDVNDPLSSAELTLIAGSACRISAPLSCMGGICSAELELTGLGLCQVRATGVTRDGIAVDDCWFRGTWEADPADTTFALQMAEAAESAHASCLAIAP